MADAAFQLTGSNYSFITEGHRIRLAISYDSEYNTKYVEMIDNQSLCTYSAINGKYKSELLSFSILIVQVIYNFSRYSVCIHLVMLVN